MKMIPKFCHNTKCMYVCQSNPELDCYAHQDGECPNCKNTTSLKAEMPDWCIGGLIRLWWRKHHAMKRKTR
jgi:hypothetical protein